MIKRHAPIRGRSLRQKNLLSSDAFAKVDKLLVRNINVEGAD